MNLKFLLTTAIAFSFLGLSPLANANEEIGSVDTAFKLVGANHKIVANVFEDPLVNGISCYVSSAKTGGISGSLGLAEDSSDASVSCVQTGIITVKEKLPKQAEVFNKNSSVFFKKVRVVRIVDSKRQTLIYLQYSDKLIDGSPKNSITAVPVGKPIPIK